MRKNRNGLSRTPEYRCWKDMLRRCLNSYAVNFNEYGGRGVQVCARWLDFESFLADMGLRPSPIHSIDRWPDPDGHYELRNVRWATPQQQVLNQRRTRKLRGVPLFELGQANGLNERTVRARVRLGWTFKDAVNTLAHKHVRLSAMDKKTIRAIRGLSQQEIADRYGIAQQTVSTIRRGVRR